MLAFLIVCPAVIQLLSGIIQFSFGIFQLFSGIGKLLFTICQFFSRVCQFFFCFGKDFFVSFVTAPVSNGFQLICKSIYCLLIFF